MSRPSAPKEDKTDLQIQENVTKWQSTNNPLAPLTDKQLDLIYQIEDEIKRQPDLEESSEEVSESQELTRTIPQINSYQDYIKWMVAAEEDVKHENLRDYMGYYETLCQHNSECNQLFQLANNTSDLLQELRKMYLQVTAKTDSLHSLSEQLMAHQKVLKEKKKSLNDKLHYFLMFRNVQDNIERYSSRISSQEFIEQLNVIDNAIEYLNNHPNFKESRIYRMKYESLLANALNKLYHTVSNLIAETTKHVVDPESETHLVPLNTSNTGTEDNESANSAFALYYGKFQSAAAKVKLILEHVEGKVDKNQQYENVVSDCQKFYVSQRLPVLSAAVVKALHELRDKHKSDCSVLFRSCGLFLMKTCQDEASCFHYFFSQNSAELDDYLGVLCQQLYDTLRPSLITINHVEILSELCGILQKEMLNDTLRDNSQLTKYAETIKQLLQDVEERLVFRTNVFFQHDLLAYNPSPGDLAYPEKLEQMENIVMDLQESSRPSSRASSVSQESQEMTKISSGQQQFRSYTGNSPADLHGMWYPTVKRTLVILSRLYFCLDRETFQGLAQEALLICIRTVQKAADLISSRKTEIDGQLFQIKHLLIIREQIAPFQVDFTAKEMSLDFSGVQKAAVELIHRRDKLFTFGSNNALLAFLLEGTPRVREYLVDSRKEIDKQLKHSCEAFIMCATAFLVGNVQEWIRKAENYMTKANSEGETRHIVPLPKLDVGQAKVLSEMVAEALKNTKAKIPEVQRSMQLYLANRETEFILFRPIKNNVINVFVQLEQTLIAAKYSEEELILIGCPSPEQVNILICSVSLTSEQDQAAAHKQNF